jgi:hypothetical protein
VFGKHRQDIPLPYQSHLKNPLVDESEGFEITSGFLCTKISDE